MRDFRKYEIWKLSHQFTLEVYRVTKFFPSDKLYGISSQLRRASSIPSNISEGCGRTSDSEFNRFLTIALGSASETEYLIEWSKDLQYMDKEAFEKLNSEINLIKQKTYKLKQKLVQSA